MPDSNADSLDDLVGQRMRERKIPGLSLAIVDNGEIVRVQGYGYADEASQTAVTAETLFQAGSISKPVAALAALRLVERGALALDGDVNLALRGWKVPENEFTVAQKVTVRRILSHGAGFTVHGFAGYDARVPVPTLLEVLDGANPANSAPIRVAAVPGSQWQYSGGGYVVLQQMMIEAGGQPFPELMHDLALQPAHMTASTYEQSWSEERKRRASTGYYPGKRPVPGRWHIYPEMAAAGLWTTPSDLARFVVLLQRILAGGGESVLSAKLAREMFTPQQGQCGLGVFLQGRGPGRQFFHEGRDEGFDALMIGTAETGKGAVVMVNTNDDSGTCGDVIREIARQYHWR